MRQIKSERIGRFLVIEQLDECKRLFKTVFLDYIPVARFDVHQIKERRLAAVDLVERGVCDRKTAGNLCGFHRNTVVRLVRAKRLLGLDAVLNDVRGLKAPYKYVDEIRSHIKRLLDRGADRTDQAIAEQAAKDLGLDISRSSVARIRTAKHGETQGANPLNRKDLMDMAKVAEAIDREDFDAQQLSLQFQQDPALKAKSEEAGHEPAPKAATQTQRALIARLQAGQRCVVAGGLMHHLFLGEIDFKDLVDCYPSTPGATFQASDILATLFHSVNQDIASVEALKLVNAGELGVLMGCSRAPDKETIRDHLTRMANHCLSGKLIERFARRLLEQARIDREVFFIDGHFLPYYGLNVISKGYYTVRRLAMRGNELYAVSDLQGRPLFFITESNEIDFRPIICRCAAMFKDWGIARPVLVFDRGGYGIHFFSELNRQADFVTWAKYVTEASLDRIAEASFGTGLICNGHKYLVADQISTVSESAQTAQRDNRTKPTSMELRLVVLKNVDTGKRLGIYTSDFTKPGHDIGYYMLQRWGDSENFFKEMTARFNLNYHPGYDIAELEKQPLVENPDILLIKKAIKALKNELERQQTEVIVVQAKLHQRQDRRLEKKLANLNTAIEQNQTDIAQFEQKLTTLPDKVSIVELLKGKPMNRCDLEKKKLYDLMQFMAFHSREALVDIFRTCYDDHRDVKQVLDLITTRSGYVKLIGQTLIVILDWIQNRKHREAAERLCQILNKKGVSMVGRLNLKLFFHVSPVPKYSPPGNPAGEHFLS
jgi:transposase